MPTIEIYQTLNFYQINKIVVFTLGLLIFLWISKLLTREK
jgi:hypothetical protein